MSQSGQNKMSSSGSGGIQTINSNTPNGIGDYELEGENGVTVTQSTNSSTIGLNISGEGVVFYDGSTTYTGIDANTATYVLTSNGTGIAPSFQVLPSSSGSITQIDGDSGSALPIAGVLNLIAGSTGLDFVASSSTVTLGGILNVANGGTGAATLTGILIGNGTSAFTASILTQHDVLIGGASNAITSVSPSTANLVLASNGVSADPSFKALSALGAVTQVNTNSGNITPASGIITLQGGTTGLTFSGSSSIASLTGTLNVANGGTGAATLTGILIGNGTSAFTASILTQHDVLIGGASNAITSVSPSSSGLIFASNGTSVDPSFQALSSLGAVTQVNTNSGNITPASGIITLQGGTTGLTFSGSSSTASLTGTLVVSNGGSGLNMLNPYAVLVGGTTTTSSMQQVSGLGSSGQVLTSQGSSALPIWQPLPSNLSNLNWIAVATSSFTLTATVGVLSGNTGATAVALPTSGAAVGTSMGISIVGAGGIATITMGTGQKILIGSTTYSTSVASTAIGDTLVLINAIAASGSAGSWVAINVVGNWTGT